MQTKHQQHILELMTNGWQMLELPDRRILRLFIGFDEKGASLFRIKRVRNDTFTAMLERGAIYYADTNDEDNPYICAA